jgi:hypothetical protein
MGLATLKRGVERNLLPKPKFSNEQTLPPNRTIVLHEVPKDLQSGELDGWRAKSPREN